ncbi:MAG: DUF3943 domain-containing protein, partial [Prevotellaceae bacterium]|nr:DUF3943 domain-containing protein [Prevotellaceae bacterium]
MKFYRFNRTILFSGIFLMCFSLSGKSQHTAFQYPVTGLEKTAVRDSLFHAKKDWGTALGLTLGSNITVWGFSRYITHADYAYIGINTVKENFKKGFVWDNDMVGTNMFMHPYHGSLYFNAARANGFSFWESGGFAFGGSLMWEMLMENEYPSINDIVATPVGGLVLGEVFYRISDLILDDRRSGIGRLGREAAGFLISPIRGITRIMNGDAWRRRNTSGKQFGMPQVSVEFSVGIRALELQDDIFDKGVGMTTNINVEYGDRFDDETEKPYDYFTFNANMHVQQSQPFLGEINIKGRLYAAGLIDSQKDFLSLGVYQHFDYYDSDVISALSPYVPYRFCAPASFGLGLVYDNKRFKRWTMDSYFHANLILMGASLSDHYVVDGRNYNLANGFSWQLGINLSNKKNFNTSLYYGSFLFFTWKGYDKDIDWDKVNPLTLNAQGDESQAVSRALH